MFSEVRTVKYVNWKLLKPYKGARKLAHSLLHTMTFL